MLRKPERPGHCAPSARRAVPSNQYPSWPLLRLPSQVTPRIASQAAFYPIKRFRLTRCVFLHKTRGGKSQCRMEGSAAFLFRSSVMRKLGQAVAISAAALIAAPTNGIGRSRGGTGCPFSRDQCRRRCCRYRRLHWFCRKRGPLISAARLWRLPRSLPATKKSRRGDRGSSSILSVAVFACPASMSPVFSKKQSASTENCLTGWPAQLKIFRKYRLTAPWRLPRLRASYPNHGC